MDYLNFSLSCVHNDTHPSIRCVLFDLDGTLIDHFRVIYRCYQYALDKLGLEPVTYDKVRAAVGGSIVVTFGKLIDQEFVERAVAHYREEFDRIWNEDIEVLPGAEWLLEQLHAKGIRIAVFTNKEGNRARNILDYVGLSTRLDGTYGTLDTPWRKPQPEFTRYVMNELGADPLHTIMVGDSPYDVETALVASMPCYLVATGSHSLKELRQDSRVAGVYPDLYKLGEDVFNLKSECYGY